MEHMDPSKTCWPFSLFLHLIFLFPAPHHSYSGLFSALLVPSGHPPTVMTLALSPPSAVGAGLGSVSQCQKQAPHQPTSADQSLEELLKTWAWHW